MRPSLAAVILGTVCALFPEVVINWTKRVILGPSFKNAADLQPRGWYVTAVRIQAALVALAGIAWFVLERKQMDSNQIPEPDLTPAEE